MLSNRHKGLIRGLIYPVQFDPDPVDGVDRVLELVVYRRALDAGPDEYSAAIAAALQSDEQLAPLIPQPHSEPVIRAYLTALQQRLA
jgi:hypothetical protein